MLVHLIKTEKEAEEAGESKGENEMNIEQL